MDLPGYPFRETSHWKPALEVARAAACVERYPQVHDIRPIVPQPPSSLKVGPMSEDCLYLNVWTPAKSPSEKLPVMVWIYGGSFAFGSGSQPDYQGHNLSKLGVVVVTINYRLGPLGFMAHPLLSRESPKEVSGNYGRTIHQPTSGEPAIQGSVPARHR